MKLKGKITLPGNPATEPAMEAKLNVLGEPLIPCVKYRMISDMLERVEVERYGICDCELDPLKIRAAIGEKCTLFALIRSFLSLCVAGPHGRAPNAVVDGWPGRSCLGLIPLYEQNERLSIVKLTSSANWYVIKILQI